METLIHANPSIFLFHFPTEFPNCRNRVNFNCKRPNFSTSFSSTSSTIYPLSTSSNLGGWDDLRVDSPGSTDSTQLQHFLVTLGINDKKYIYVFLFGVISALSISRVRVSSVILFPASITIFAVGFLLGFLNKVSNAQVKKRSKDEILGISVENLRNLIEFFDGFDVKVENFKSSVKKAIRSNRVTVEDLEFYVEGIELIRSSMTPAKGIVETCINSNKGDLDGTVVESPKRSKKKELGDIGLDAVQFIGSLFGEKKVDSKGTKLRDGDMKRDGVPNNVNKQIRGLGAARSVDDNMDNGTFGNDILNTLDLDQDEVKRFGENVTNGRINRGNIDYIGMDDKIGKRLDRNVQYSYERNNSQYMNNNHTSLHAARNDEIENWTRRDRVLDSMDFGVRLRHTETEAFFGQSVKRSAEDFRSSSIEGGGEMPTELSGNIMPGVSSEGNSPRFNEFVQSSNISEDVMFDRYLSEANSLLKEARECLGSKDNEGKAESVLFRSAKILSKAIDLKPMSLLAVGQLGNTYLLHGELKLKISRKLRVQLQSGDMRNNQEQLPNLLQDQVVRKDRMAALLIDACEECEDLLVEAGRKYRMALSIDGNDTRALYNWGLALSFRAQLIADIGPEAASDADKVFLAAIDKFNAMMAKGNLYAPDALFRWGSALQQRSRLRPVRSKEKVKLLQQAKRLYEDALDMDSNNHQVKEALSSCMFELNSRRIKGIREYKRKQK